MFKKGKRRDPRRIRLQLYGGVLWGLGGLAVLSLIFYFSWLRWAAGLVAALAFWALCIIVGINEGFWWFIKQYEEQRGEREYFGGKEYSG